MSYTQWDKGFLEGWKSGREAGLRAVREEDRGLASRLRRQERHERNRDQVVVAREDEPHGASVAADRLMLRDRLCGER